MRPQDFREWRVVELRPGIFGIEHRRRLFSSILGFKTIAALGWGWGEWRLQSYEFRSQIAADNFVCGEKSEYADNFYKKYGIPGYPRVVSK